MSSTSGGTEVGHLGMEGVWLDPPLLSPSRGTFRRSIRRRGSVRSFDLTPTGRHAVDFTEELLRSRLIDFLCEQHEDDADVTKVRTESDGTISLVVSGKSFRLALQRDK